MHSCTLLVFMTIEVSIPACYDAKINKKLKKKETMCLISLFRNFPSYSTHLFRMDTYSLLPQPFVPNSNCHQ